MADNESLWRVIYIAHSASAARQVEQILSSEGFLVRIRQAERESALYELLALESEAREARAFIMEKGF